MHSIEDMAGSKSADPDTGLGPAGPGRRVRRAHPIRTCIGCRTRAAQGDLMRLVAVDGRLELDLERRRSGRGAYIHGDKACLERAIKRGLFSRALRTRLDPVSSAELRERVVSVLESPMHQLTQPSTHQPLRQETRLASTSPKTQFEETQFEEPQVGSRTPSGPEQERGA